MLNDKDFTTTSKLEAFSPVSLNTDGSVSPVSVSAYTNSNGTVFPESVPQGIGSLVHIRHDKTENIIWTVDNGGRIRVFEPTKRGVSELTSIDDISSYQTYVNACWDEEHKQLVVIYSGSSRHLYSSTYRWDNGQIVRVSNQKLHSQYFYQCQIRYCNKYKTFIVFARGSTTSSSFSASRVMLYVLKNTGTNVTVLMSNVLHSYINSLGTLDIDQTRGIAVVGYGRRRGYSHDVNRSLYRVINLTATGASIGRELSHPDQQDQLARTPYFDYFPDINKWYCYFNGEYRICEVVGDGLTFSSKKSALIGNVRPIRDEASASYFALSGSSVKFFNFDADNTMVLTDTKTLSTPISPITSFTTLDGLSMYIGGSKMTVFDLVGRKSNATVKNFIGWTDAKSYEGNTNAKVKFAFGNTQLIKTNETTLTLGKSYFLDIDGELTVNPVFADAPKVGVATSSSHILIA